MRESITSAPRAHMLMVDWQIAHDIRSIIIHNYARWRCDGGAPTARFPHGRRTIVKLALLACHLIAWCIGVSSSVHVDGKLDVLDARLVSA